MGDMPCCESLERNANSPANGVSLQPDHHLLPCDSHLPLPNMGTWPASEASLHPSLHPSIPPWSGCKEGAATLSQHSPQGTLDAHHAQLLRAVEEFALELHVLQHSSDVRPVVLSHGPADSQVVAVPWKTPPGSLSGLRASGWGRCPAQLRAGFALQRLSCSPELLQLAQPGGDCQGRRGLNIAGTREGFGALLTSMLPFVGLSTVKTK